MHSHCSTCIKVNRCSVRPQPDRSCPIVGCDSLGCPAVMHQCKLQDHALICKHKRTSCLNADYGCDAIILRKDLAKHLVRCPANVVHCTAEWNRWPVHTRDRKLTASKLILPQALDIKHLDVALALRDQRMLGQLWTAERKTRKVMANYLTQKYPAVPIKPYRGIHLNESKSHSTSPSPTSASSASSTTTGTSTPSRSTATPSSEDVDSESSPWLASRNPAGLQNSVMARLTDNNCQYRNCWRPPIRLIDHLDFSTVVEPLKTPETDIPSPPALPQCNFLSLDINVCSIAPHQKKPLLMYTFKCAHELRRDEFEWHYKNFHSDILGSIDGWMEHRCPLWQYGCNFVDRRWNPEPNGARIVFSSAVESFGLKMPTTVDDQTEDQIQFETLPFEVWQNICRHLDSFSINNLSLTSKRLREVCRSLLDHRGLVSLQWQRTQDENGRYTWDVAYKKWFFSSAFSPVSCWRHTDRHAVVNHLSQCPFNVRLPKTEAFKLPPIPNRNDESKKHI